MIQLRPYQDDAVARVGAAIRRLGAAREQAARALGVLLVAPTGAGKTVIASRLVDGAFGKKKRVLFVAHRRELIAQAHRKFVEIGLPDSEVGVIMAGDPRRRPQAAVQVASVDTLRFRTLPQGIDLVIFDEAHRSLAPGYVRLAAHYRDAVLVGLTASPWRSDKQGLGVLYDDLVLVASPQALIDMGFLVEPRVWTVPQASLPDLSKVPTSKGDYDQKALAAAVDQAGLVGDIVDHWKRRAAGVRTVAFAASVEHSRHIARRFTEAGVPAEHLDGETPTPDRDAILARLDRGETLVVSNCGVLCEGWDQPSVKCAILARPTKSVTLYLQQAGRILRPFQGLEAVILDHAGNALAHGLPQDEREYSLAPPKSKKKSVAGPPVKTCEACFAIVPAATRVCPGCGVEFLVEESGPALPKETAGELVDAKAARSADLALYDAIVEEWHARNARRAVPMKPYWCVREYESRHGKKPPKGYKLPRFTPEQKVTRSFEDDLKAARETPPARRAAFDRSEHVEYVL